VLLFVAMLVVSAAAPIVSAQENPIGRNSFISPKYGTEITWSRDWVVDRSESALEQNRDILFLNNNSLGVIAFVELRSQRSYRTAEQALEGFVSRLSSEETLEVVEDNSTAYPPNLTYEQGRKGEEVDTFIQAQVSPTAMVVSAIVSLPEETDDAFELAQSTIKIDGVAMFDFQPICGAEGESTSSSSGGGTSKTSAFETSATPEAGGDCVTIATPTAGKTPTPVPTESGGKRTNLNSETYVAQTFPVTFDYDATQWEISDDLAAADNNGRDSVLFDNTELASTLVVEAYEGHGGKAGTCIDLSLREWGIQPGVNEVLQDRDGNDLVGSVRGKVWGAYAFTYVDTSGDTDSELDLNAYVECRALPGGKGVVVITLLSQPGDFLDAFDQIQLVLTSMRIG
jgi:hypothetical protein